MSLVYYVYAYLREDFSPYYIGKGKDDRAYARWRKGRKLTPEAIKKRTESWKKNREAKKQVNQNKEIVKWP